MAQAIIDYSGEEIRLRTPYVAAFVRDLKMNIPGGYRRWDETTKTWLVDQCYADDVESLCALYFPDHVMRIGVDEPAPSLPAWCRTLYVLPDAPQEVVKAAYHALAKKYHPDLYRQPDANERMRLINQAYGEWPRDDDAA